MLPAQARVRTRADHRLVAARGRRVGSGPLVLHLMTTGSGPARAGIVVGRRVGPAVQRNLVKRRLRELLRDRLPELPAGSMLVVRARPEAGASGWVQLGAALDTGLRKLQRPGGRPGEPGSAAGRWERAVGVSGR